MLQSSNNATTIQQYKEVVQKFQHFLEERAKQKQKQDDKLSIAIKRINLHSLLPTLQSDNHQQKNRISKRLSTLQKEQYSQFKQESIDQINNNIQKSIVTPYSNYVSQFKHGKSQSNLDAFQQLGFLHGLYKCDKLEHQSRYISIKDLNQKQRKQSDECQENHIHLPTLQQPHNEIPRQVSKKHTSKKASHEEILYTNRWERDRGNNVVRIDRFEVDKLTKDVVDYIFNQDIIKIFFENKNPQQLYNMLQELLKGVYYESLINFEEMIQYFTSLQFSYLEFFYIKYAIAQVLINANYNYLFVERALNQFEEYRYLIQKPIPFITQLFDNTFYSTIVKDLMMRLLRSAAYNKFLQTQKFESEQFIMAIKNGLFPYLVGDYVALPLHARIKDVKAEQFRQQTLKPFINSTFVIYVKNILKEYNLEDLYINDVERRLIFPKARSNQMEDSNFPMHYIYSYIQCQNILIPSYDIKALIKVIKIDPIVSESDSTIFEDNLSYLSKFEQIQDDIQPFL
ncbi:unnamed protein product (macronuclear) [Paramecium tetraurelia]|uniref:RGS domain-containing protein n=1 Tax=Paramecium tetraurelia TaxID=5888 RepID=A0DV83_PARTE|nr:uncharacterized protein GSPATT00020614001 [Paramecium tetraurelia]CAK86950.1 unnamed protein product [Paramecium tetraurelia]|eukprot:XP_001454347.1 hypothetical protein (macronuclear) [Paramecium tetraurelia strain d4-2]